LGNAYSGPGGSENSGQPITKVSKGSGALPNEQGQVWREYDISPYTMRVTCTERPEQAIIDWIFRETGYEAWHGEPLGVLSANRGVLRVYHTPRMQAAVAALVDRFVHSEAETLSFTLRMITLEQPNWRLRVQRLLQPVGVQTAGASAWLLEREDAAVLMADLKRRSDFREHCSPHLLVNNGQAAVFAAMRPRPYAQEVVPRPDVFPGYETRAGKIEEGFTLEFSPLLSLDRRMLDATIKCNIDQVEKLVPVLTDIALANGTQQRVKIDVPQVAQFRFHERFRWPVEKVLLLSMGIVAMPVPIEGKATVAGLPLPIPGGAPRAELLLLVEHKGPLIPASRVGASTAQEPKNYHGRY
jgi:hypothetical protein